MQSVDTDKCTVFWKKTKANENVHVAMHLPYSSVPEEFEPVHTIYNAICWLR